MNSRIKQAMLRIILIQEEFTEAEIAEAVRFLQEDHSDAMLIQYLTKQLASPEEHRKRIRSQRSKPIAKQQSRAVKELEQSDPDKYQLLSGFDQLLRSGQILPELEQITNLGLRLSKDFDSGKSRRAAIPALMSLISARSLDEVKEIAELALSISRPADKGDEYQELAHFIMTGRRRE